jgi:hypothetical protein
MNTADVETILSYRHDNGADLWATPDKNLCKGAPFSTLESVLYLVELVVSPSDPLIKEAAELIFSTQRDDGRFKIATSAIYPCHYGIGTLFMQVEYPFRTYNIFNYVYVLSFYERARKDRRFLEAFEILRSKLADGHVVIERVAPKLAKLSFCEKGKPSAHATKRYQEILENRGE